MQQETNTPEVVTPVEQQLVKENITKQVIEKLKADYMGLKINGIDDAEGFEKVEEARKECKRLRGAAVKICKAARDEANKYSAYCITKEKEVVGEISEVEDYLESQSEFIKKEKARVLFEHAQREKLPARKEELLKIGVTVPDEQLLKATDAQYTALFNEFYNSYIEERERKVKEQEAAIQAEKDAAAKKKQDEEAEIKRKQDEADAAAKKDTEIKAAADAAAEKAKADAAQAVKDAEAKAAKTEADAKAAAIKAEEDKAAALKKAEDDKNAALAKQKADQEAEVKAKADRDAKLEAERLEHEQSMGDEEKFNDLVTELKQLCKKYTFKSKKYSGKYAVCVDLLIKTINFITK